MANGKMNISVADLKNSTGEVWYRDAKVNRALEMLVECGEYIQCTHDDHIVLRSKRGEALFDKSGNLCELYDYQSQSKENIANQPDSQELEFEMVLMFSKINE